MAAPDGRLYTSAYLLGEDFPAINVTSMSMARGKIYLGGNGKYLELQLPAAHPEKPSRILLPDIPPGVESLTFDVGEAPRLRVATDNLSEAVPYFRHTSNTVSTTSMSGPRPLTTQSPWTHSAPALTL